LDESFKTALTCRLRLELVAHFCICSRLRNCHMSHCSPSSESCAGKRKLTREPLAELASPKVSRRSLDYHTSPATKRLTSAHGAPSSSSKRRSSMQRCEASGAPDTPSKSGLPTDPSASKAETKSSATPKQRLAVMIKRRLREQARRTQAALSADKARRRHFHEVPGRFEADHLLRIRADVGFDMMCEALARRDEAAGTGREVTPRELFK